MKFTKRPLSIIFHLRKKKQKERRKFDNYKFAVTKIVTRVKRLRERKLADICNLFVTRGQTRGKKIRQIDDYSLMDARRRSNLAGRRRY